MVKEGLNRVWGFTVGEFKGILDFLCLPRDVVIEVCGFLNISHIQAY